MPIGRDKISYFVLGPISLAFFIAVDRYTKDPPKNPLLFWLMLLGGVLVACTPDILFYALWKMQQPNDWVDGAPGCLLWLLSLAMILWGGMTF